MPRLQRPRPAAFSARIRCSGGCRRPITTRSGGNFAAILERTVLNPALPSIPATRLGELRQQEFQSALFPAETLEQSPRANPLAFQQAIHRYAPTVTSMPRNPFQPIGRFRPSRPLADHTRALWVLAQCSSSFRFGDVPVADTPSRSLQGS